MSQSRGMQTASDAREPITCSGMPLVDGDRALLRQARSMSSLSFGLSELNGTAAQAG